MCLKMAEVFAAFWYSIIGRLLCTNSRKEDQKEEKSGVQIFDLQHFDLYSPHQPMSASLAFTTEAMRLKEKDPLKPKQPMSAFFIFRNERRAESKCGWEVIEEWNNMTEKQKKPYEKIAKQNMEKYLEEMEAYKQRKEEGSANPKKEEDEMMKIHKQEALELLKKKEKTKENRQKKKKKIADPNKPKKPASSFLLFSGVCGFEPSFWNSACCNKKLQQAVEWPLKHSAAFSRLGVSPVCGILLHGPPGCSKTTLAKAAAHATQASFFSLRELYSMYVGEGEALLHNTFRRARLAAPCIIFFDEADVAAKRGGKSSSNIAVGERLLSTLLTEMDGLEQAKGILVLAATNRPHAIDAALMWPGRFDQLFWGNDFDLKQIAEDTELFTGAELEGLCREAGIVALREDISASVVCNCHFQTVWKSLKPALTREEVNSYSSFMKNPSLISSGSSKASAKQNTKHTMSLLGSVGPVSIGILSFILLAGVKYFFMQTDRFPNELATT
ncbi:unnamed protein product [Camellia sinensis]